MKNSGDAEMCCFAEDWNGQVAKSSIAVIGQGEAGIAVLFIAALDTVAG